VDHRLDCFLGGERRRWQVRHPQLGLLAETLGQYVSGKGKRLRASFCLAGWEAAGGGDDVSAAVDVAAALELLHAFALIHDDVMDGSERRRGAPSLHCQIADAYRLSGGRGEPRRFGEGLAVLVGDAALAWADLLLGPHRALVGSIWDEMRVELSMGQYLDVVTSTGSPADGRSPWVVAALKSGRYTVTRPLQLGAAVGGRLAPLSGPLSRFGDPVGEAFQLRDDILGVFGDPAVTGKPAGEDLREAKNTILLQMARRRATPPGRRLLGRVGQGDLTDAEVGAIRRLMEDCGAVAAVEDAITRRMEAAAAAVTDPAIPPATRDRLMGLAAAALWRSR
jgi:geranylgeranyl diphosphate synthase type I